MSKITTRETAARDGGSAEHRLARLLDSSSLARVVPHLAPETLHQLIRHYGLEACGELVTLATSAQLTSLLDIDLWRSARPGHDGQFDVDRFGEWIEMLVDTGDSVAARTVAALDTNLVVAGLSRYVRVFDPGIFEPIAQSDDETIDRHEAMREGDVMAGDVPTPAASRGRYECEVGGYIIRARSPVAWDAIVALLIALNAGHGDYFHAVMRGCQRLSNSMPEIDGLDDLLPAPQQHLNDIAIEREIRRSLRGYATPADARAFLQMARQPARTRSGASATGTMAAHPIVAAYFRAADEAQVESSKTSVRSPDRLPESADATDVSESIAAVIDVLTEAGMMPERPRALLAAADSDPQAPRLTRLRQLMDYARDTNDTAYFDRNRELAFLANTLLAGCSVQSRPFTPQEASDAAASICNLGLEHSPDKFPADAFLTDHDLVTAFEMGWSALYQEVSLFVVQQLIATLGHLHSVDRDIQRGLTALKRSLVKHRKAGTPWLARDAADVLAMLDMTAWTSVLGLLDECPILPATLIANLDGRTTTVSPTAFDFISTPAQIGDIRSFMKKLPDILSR
jgi:hypothetical protein